MLASRGNLCVEETGGLESSGGVQRNRFNKLVQEKRVVVGERVAYLGNICTF